MCSGLYTFPSPALGPPPGPQARSDPSAVDRIERANTWADLKRWAEILLGPTSFNLGVCYGIVENLASSVADILDLLRIIILAGMYERTQHPPPWWDVPDWPSWATAEAARRILGDARLKRAHDRFEALVRDVRYAFTHPSEFLGLIKDQYVAKWRRFLRLSAQTSLSSQFEAGKIVGEVLLDLIALIGLGEAAVKLAAKVPELAKWAVELRGAIRLRPRIPGGAGAVDAAEQARAAAAAGRTGAAGTAEGAEAGAARQKPEWLRRVEEGNEFNRQRRAAYPYNEVYVNNPKGGYYVLDSYDPRAGEIVSRKFTQFSDIEESTGVGYVKELAGKYSPQATIADVPSTRGNLPPELIGKPLNGQMILEVPAQNGPIPQAVLDAAEENSVIIRDVNGRVY